MQGSLLVVDDEEGIRRSLAIALRRVGYEVLQAENGIVALKLTETQEVDVVVADFLMQPMNGIELLKTIKQKMPDVEVIILTGVDKAEPAKQALKLGAYDYVVKGGNYEEVILLVGKALEKRRLAITNRHLATELSQVKAAHGLVETIIGQSAAIAAVRKRIARVAPTHSTVLITGGTGTGKELVARAMHALSPRKDKAFVTINCSALPEQLLESELFGHVQGAFTDAVSARTGLLEEANGGSFFLDEVALTPMGVQTKLLRVLEDRVIRRMGSNESHPVDVRIIAATNEDLESAIRERRFREDLFYRLNVITIEVPPLRERKEDIPLLALHFLRHHAKAMGKEVTGFSREAMEVVCEYDYPGNVRELRNAIESALTLASGNLVTPEDLPAFLTKHRHLVASVESQEAQPASLAVTSKVAQPLMTPSAAVSIDEAEKLLILRAVKAHPNNLAEAAKTLGISRTTLWRRLKQYGIQEQG